LNKFKVPTVKGLSGKRVHNKAFKRNKKQWVICQIRFGAKFRVEWTINWNALSAISTAIAALVALGLGIFPSIIRSRIERELAVERTYNRMKTVQLVVKKYRYYNVQKIVQDGFTQYQYDTSNAKSIAINIDLYQEANKLHELAEKLDGKVKSKVTTTLDLLVGISSGFPFHKEDWDRLETLIDESINQLKAKM